MRGSWLRECATSLLLEGRLVFSKVFVFELEIDLGRGIGRMV